MLDKNPDFHIAFLLLHFDQEVQQRNTFVDQSGICESDDSECILACQFGLEFRVVVHDVKRVGYSMSHCIGSYKTGDNIPR